MIKVVFNYRSTHRRHFIKKVFLRCSLSKRDLKVFSCEYCKRTAKNNYLKEDLRMAASITTQNTYTIVQEILRILTIKARLRYSREKLFLTWFSTRIVEMKAWLLLSYFKCLRNQLSSMYSIGTYWRVQIFEKSDSSNILKVETWSHQKFLLQNLNWFLSSQKKALS